ncbi:SAM-dependent methyltransferase, partial [Actinomadura adrarensis]
CPSLPQAAQANRAWMHRVVRHMAGSGGLRQFVDIGAGIPTSPNPWDIARQVDPSATVVGVDNDPVVLAYARAHLNGMPLVEGDIHHPGQILARLDRIVNWHRPVGLLFIAVLHFVKDTDNPARIVQMFLDRMTPGSMIAISHICSTGAASEAVEQVEQVYERSTAPGQFRTERQIKQLFCGLPLLEPGLVPVQEWPQASKDRPPTDVPVLGGVAQVPPPRATTGTRAGGLR